MTDTPGAREVARAAAEGAGSAAAEGAGSAAASDQEQAHRPGEVTAALLDGAAADVVEVTLPARSSYVAVLRTTAAALASRLEFTIDEIEDLRIGVDEACALVLAQADEGARLSARFRVVGPELDVAVSAPAAAARIPAQDSFAWTVLTALAGPVDASLDPDGRLTIRLGKRGTLAGAGIPPGSGDGEPPGTGEQ